MDDPSVERDIRGGDCTEKNEEGKISYGAV